MSESARTRVQLTVNELARLRAEVERDAPRFADRLNRFAEIEQVDLPWFRRYRILDVQSNVPFPAQRIYVAMGSRTFVLSGHADHLREVAAEDPPTGLEDEMQAKNYAVECNGLAEAYPVGELVIESFDEIPFYKELGDSEQRVIDELRSRFATRIRPEDRTHTDRGWVFHSWLIAMSGLIERTLIVPPDGKLLRNDTMHATHMPVPFGNHWGMRNGRLVPIG